MLTVFYWRGEPIRDIEQWAQTRGEHIVLVEEAVTYPSVFTGRIETEVRQLEMPESFFNSAHITPSAPGHTMTMKEISRREPLK
jgi:hypothetical protein